MFYNRHVDSVYSFGGFDAETALANRRTLLRSPDENDIKTMLSQAAANNTADRPGTENHETHPDIFTRFDIGKWF
jgi:hypothetical protein